MPRMGRWIGLALIGLSLAPGSQAAGLGPRLDHADEALRLFGAGPAGEAVSGHRALVGNRIVYGSGGNEYPDERAMRFFRLDHGEKQSGDFSVRFEHAGDANVGEVGFMPGPYQEGWNLSGDWHLALWLKADGATDDGKWSCALWDHRGHRAEGALMGFVTDGRWHRVEVSLAALRQAGAFDPANVRTFQLSPRLRPGGRLWFDEVRFVHRASGRELAITDKQLDQRLAEAEASRAQRVAEAFREVAGYTPALLKADGRHVYWRDLLNPLFARLWLGEDVAGTNAELRRILASTDPAVRGEYELDDPWSLYLSPMLIQLYSTFGRKAQRMPGRLEPATERLLLEVLWERTRGKNDIVNARQSPWWMAGSENHDINAKVVNLLSAQIFMHEPDYADRVYPDYGQGSGYRYGRVGLETPEGGGRARFKDGGDYRAREHYEAWVEFWQNWFTTRARRGPFIEVNSATYMLYSLGFLQSLCDLAEDESLRRSARKFFDLVWADWAQDQIGGVRGGARTRSANLLSGYDSMTQYSKFLFGGPGNAFHGFYQLLLSDYQMPPVAWEMALDREGMGSFAYVSRRPGEEQDVWPRPLGNERTLLCDTRSRLLRYSWVTPDYVLGTQMDHPATVHSHLSIDRRVQSMIFADAPDCSVRPGPLYSGTPSRLIGGSAFDERDLGAWRMGTDHVFRSVQHRQVLITQQARNIRRVSPEWFPDYDILGKPYGILFQGGFDRRAERNGWIFVAKGNAYLAVRVVVAREEHRGDAFRTLQGDKPASTPLGENGYEWNHDQTIARLKNRYSPIIFEAGRRADYATFEDFQRNILDNALSLHPTVLAPNLGFDVVRYRGCGTEARTIEFNAANSEIPTVDGTYVDYAPGFLFHSPTLQSDYESGIITVRKGSRELTLDFNRE